MTKYRDLLIERYDTEIGCVVGCGLDRLHRDVSEGEIRGRLRERAKSYAKALANDILR